MTEATDLSEYKTAHDAAKAAGKKIKEIASGLDQDPELEVSVQREELRGADYKWTVSWPGGLFDWAVVLTGGESLFAGEMPSVRQGSNNPQLTGFYDHSEWSVEAENRSKLGFYPQ